MPSSLDNGKRSPREHLASVVKASARIAQALMGLEGRPLTQ
jgi:hypothetical protein